MSHAFLTDLARRISLHPSCRVELRHHWPAPHYHKTPQDVEEEAEDLLRRQAARSALGLNSSEPFNPYDHDRVRMKREPAQRSRRHKDGHDDEHQASVSEAQASPPFKEASLDLATAGARGSSCGSLRGAAAAVATKKVLSTTCASSPSSKPTVSTTHPTATSQKAGSNTEAKTKSSRSPVTSALAQLGPKEGHTKSSNGGAAIVARTPGPPAVPTTNSGPPQSQKLAEQVKERGPSPSSSSSKHVVSTSTKKGAMKAHEEAHVTSPARTRARRGKREEAAKAAKGNPASRSSSSSCPDKHRGSDVQSEESVPCRNPLNIRLPRNPVHHTMGGVPRPLHLTVRWSGVQQRRRRYNRQLRRRLSEQEDATPQRQAEMRPSSFKVASSEASPIPSDPHQHAPITVHELPLSTGYYRSGAAEEVEKADAMEGREGYDRESHKLCSSSIDVHAQGGETNPRPLLAASASISTSHSLQPPSTIDEVSLQASLGSSDANREARGKSVAGSTRSGAHSLFGVYAQQQQQNYYYARQPTFKSTTAFSQSTITAPRTSVLGITYSELPTPSSSADPYAAPCPRSYLRRPHSLLIVRSPLPENSSDSITAAATSMCYHPCSGSCNRVSNNNSSSSNPNNVGPHGLQAGSGSNLRVTYVTSGNINTSNVSEGAAGSQQQWLRDLAHVTRPYAPTTNAQGYAEMGNYAPIRSNPGSPSTAKVSSCSVSGATAANFSSPTPPNAFPAAPLKMLSAHTSATNNGSSNNPSSAAVMRSAAPPTASPVGKQTSPPLSMKTVMVQRRRSSLLRQQHAQRQQQQQPPFGIFPSPGAVAAHLLYNRLSNTATACQAAPSKLQQVQSNASSTTATVAFSPLTVDIAAKMSDSSPSPLVARGPMSVDALEGSPLPGGSAKPEDASSPSEANVNRSLLADPHGAKLREPYSAASIHEDPMALSDPAAHSYLAIPPQRNSSVLSTNGGGSIQLPMYLAQPYQSNTDVLSAAPYGATSGSLGVSGDPYTGSIPYGDGGGDEGLRGEAKKVCHVLAHSPTTQPPYGDTDLREPLSPHTLPQQHGPKSPLGPWKDARPCYYSLSATSSWMEHMRWGATTPTAAFTPVMPLSSSCVDSTTFNMQTEGAMSMFQSQQQLQQLPSFPYQQLGASYSALCTPQLSQQPPPASSSAPGSLTVNFAVRRSRSNILRALAYPAPSGTPQVPERFCKLQRSDVQRLRRRAPLLPPETECPGMAGRLAYDAYRDAVRRGLVKEEEECSYYLSHHRYTPVPTPTGEAKARGSRASSATPASQQPARASESSPPPPAWRSRHDHLAQGAHPLCVVSLADCRVASLDSLKKIQKRASDHSTSDIKAAQDNDTSTATTANRASSTKGGPGDSGEQHRSSSSIDCMERQSSDLSESWSGPRLLYQIPRCCDDPYHRDEEALEMISVTTASSCAFGAGLDGLSWLEWMPSSPVEAGEEVLRTMPASCKSPPASTALVQSSSHASAAMDFSCAHGAQPTTAAGGSFSRPSSRTHAAASGNASFIAPPAAAAGSGVVPTSLGIAAPRNADDIGLTDATDINDQQQVASPLGTLAGALSVNADGRRTASNSGSKRHSIAEWVVSKLMKHIEKKKLKKLKKQQEREAAAAAATLRGSAGSPPPLPSEEHAPSLSSPATDRSRVGAMQARSTASTFSEYSDISSPYSSSLHRHTQSTPAAAPDLVAQELQLQQQQLQQSRLAYLAAAYQTELVIYEQKRRESLANRQGISELVERSRTRMTPEAAAAGYFYEAQWGGGSGSGDHRQHPQRQRDRDASCPRITAPSSRKRAAGTAVTAQQPREGTGGESVRHHRKGARSFSNTSATSSSTRSRHSSTTYSSSCSEYLQVVISVASPVPTDDGTVSITSKPSPTAKMATDRKQHAPNFLPAREKADKRAPQQRSQKPLRERQRQTTAHTRAAAKKVEAEQVQVALDTVRTKHKSIETWIGAMYYPW
ncbi:hypothetical protein ABL78_3314 [Leptomonas seymouri]|uniref:Uncharacterized protein n=1 Tax=Leptomonas seymouri TaxID=5684 RepID=A0A0N1I4Y4_LEPSE|nr:hypothetical protein ABL78_3314 [Leptomonas seymouri]|eukprot:KPI87605.1 hypothetical protein ABL78_3314 [Leptomonas seymouri]